MRTSILLYYMQGYQIKEIAEITENSEDAIKKQLSRGRQELKHLIGKMNEDKFLKDLLSDYHPQLSDDNAFMQRLQRQMELIEEVKAYQRAESRKNKLMSLKLLAVGVVLGCIVTLASFTLPTIFDRYINGTESEFILTLLHNVQYIGLAIGAGFVTLSLLFTTKLVNLKDETPLQ